MINADIDVMVAGPETWNKYISKLESQAEEAKDTTAMAKLGMVYSEVSNGMVERNLAKAEAWFKAGALLGNPVCMRKLGDMYNFGELGYFNPEEAVFWYKTAAELGDGNACYKLSNFYLNGVYVQHSIELSNYWLQKSQELGYVGLRKVTELF